MWADNSQLSFTEVSNCRSSVIHIKFAVGEDENLLSIQIEAQICPIRVQTRKVMFSKQCKISQFIFVRKLKLKLYETPYYLASLQNIHAFPT